MKILLLLLLLTPTAFAYEVQEYKGLKVKHKIGLCPSWVSACYFHESTNINMEIYKTEREYKRILDHEYAHHVHFALMSDEDRAIWNRVTNKVLILPTLKKYNLRTDIQFAWWYASTSIYEDFAESAYAKYDGVFDSYLDLKILLAKYMMNKYAQ